MPSTKKCTSFTSAALTEVVEAMRANGVIELVWGDMIVKLGALKPPAGKVPPLFAHSHVMPALPATGLEMP